MSGVLNQTKDLISSLHKVEAAFPSTGIDDILVKRMSSSQICDYYQEDNHYLK